MKIGILQTGYLPDDLAGKYPQYPEMFKTFLDGHGFKWETYPVLDNEFPRSIYTCQGWLITGSRHGSYEDHDWIPPLEDFIRDAYDAEIPMVGICFGHQVMAQALGGRVEKFGGNWGAGKHTYESETGTTSLMAMHQDQIIKKPNDAQVIASSDFCKYAALSYKKRAMSYQAHPEFSTEFTRELIETRLGTTIPEDQGQHALDNIDGELDRQKVANEIAAFFKSS